MSSAAQARVVNNNIFSNNLPYRKRERRDLSPMGPFLFHYYVRKDDESYFSSGCIRIKNMTLTLGKLEVR